MLFQYKSLAAILLFLLVVVTHSGCSSSSSSSSSARSSTDLLVPSYDSFVTQIPSANKRVRVAVLDVFVDADQRPHGMQVADVLALMVDLDDILPLHFDNYRKNSDGTFTANLKSTWSKLPNNENIVVNLSSDQVLAGSSSSSTAFLTFTQFNTRQSTALVLAAGNDGGSNPAHDLTALSEFGASNRVIVAVGLNDAGTIHEDSNRCGNAKNFCLAAPYEVIVSHAEIAAKQYNSTTPSLSEVTLATDKVQIGGIRYSGTSFSTPLASGALSLLWSRWPNLTPQQVTSLLLDCATDLGTSGTDSIYGRGRLNLNCAFEPPSVQQLQSAGGGPGIGSLYLNGAAVETIAVNVFDKYGRDFKLIPPTHTVALPLPWDILSNLGDSTASDSGVNGAHVMFHRAGDKQAVLATRPWGSDTFSVAAWHSASVKGVAVGWQKAMTERSSLSIFSFIEESGFAGNFGRGSLEFGDSVSMVAHVMGQYPLRQHWYFNWHVSLVSSEMLHPAVDSVLQSATSHQGQLGFSLKRQLGEGCVNTSLTASSGQYGSFNVDHNDYKLTPHSSSHLQFGYQYPCNR